MESLSVLPVLLIVLSFFFEPAEAAYQFGVGDGLCIVLFLAFGVIGVCALLGWIARKRAGK